MQRVGRDSAIVVILGKLGLCPVSTQMLYKLRDLLTNSLSTESVTFRSSSVAVTPLDLASDRGKR